MNKILFRNDLFDKVLSGEKTETRRTSYYGSKNAILIAQTETGFKTCQIQILSSKKENVYNISEESVINEGFKNKKDFLDVWQEIYKIEVNCIAYYFKIVT